MQQIAQWKKNEYIPRNIYQPRLIIKIENLNMPVMSKEIKLIIKNLPTNESPGSEDVTIEFYRK